MTTIKHEVGNVYGRLTVIQKSHSAHKSVYWECQCSCGNMCIVNGTVLRRGKTVSCGCLFKEVQADRWSGIDSSLAPAKSLYGNYKRRATKKAKAFLLTFAEFIDLTQQECFYCGKLPEQVHKGSASYRGSYAYNGIDRVDNTLGYIEGNVVACCGRCNRAKDIMSAQEFDFWVEQLYTTLLQRRGL